jgi:hypothetical protein
MVVLGWTGWVVAGWTGMVPVIFTGSMVVLLGVPLVKSEDCRIAIVSEWS